MTWTNALGLCPRCEAPVERGQMVCSRCGLELVVPPYLERKAQSEFDTRVLPPAPTSRRAESKLPATAVMCAVLVLAVGMAVSGAGRNENTVRATPQDTAANVAVHASTPPESTPEHSPPGVPTRTRLNTNIAPPTHTPAPVPSAHTAKPTDTPLLLASTSTPAMEPAKLLLGTGSYVSGLNGWWVKLDGTGSRSVLWSPAPDTRHDAQGTFWLAYIVYRNDGDAFRTLGSTLNFALKGSDDKLYPEYSDGGRDPQRKKIATAMHANTLDFTVAPSQRTATVLVFDLPSGVEPVQLLARSFTEDGLSPDGQVGWSLRKNP